MNCQTGSAAYNNTGAFNFRHISLFGLRVCRIGPRQLSPGALSGSGLGLPGPARADRPPLDPRLHVDDQAARNESGREALAKVLEGE